MSQALLYEIEGMPLKAAIASTLFLIAAFALSLAPNLQPLTSICLLFVFLLAGTPKLISSLHDLVRLEINIDLLMTLAAFLSILVGSPMEGALLLVLFALSGAIEETVTAKARSAVSSLHQLAPSNALVVTGDGSLSEQPVAEIGVGVRLLVRAGEIVPLDGRVVEGASALNLAHLTGESLPASKRVGDEVPAGATNLEGMLVIEVTTIAKDSTLSRLIRLITEAQESRPKFQRWLDKIGQRYATTIIAMSGALALLLPLFGIEHATYRALAFLIAASPCALVIAIPIAYLSSISACARRGILLKGGVTLDALASCRAIAFDKTGTLTTGNLRCLGVSKLGAENEPVPDRVWQVAATLERNAVHPVAKAISKAVKTDNPIPLRSFRSLAGFGLEATLEDGTDAYIGHPDHLHERLDPSIRNQLKAATASIQKNGELLATLLLGSELYLFRFQDTPRVGIRDILSQLRDNSSLDLLMLTGDHKANADAIAAEVGIANVYADLRPEDKLAHVSRLAEECGLAMVGDGINDAPALARSTTGISMGRVGSQTAIDASDVVLLSDDLSLLDWLFGRSRLTQRIVRQNLILALLAIIGASSVALLGLVPLWLAVILHEGSTVLVGLNGLRLLR